MAKDAVNLGEIEIVPETHVSHWNRWLSDIRPWCISRQIAWGHRIPIYHCQHKELADNVYVAALDMFEARRKLSALHGDAIARNAVVKQDSDVLDTWFSSGLYPFAALGWPNSTPDMKRYFPNSLLETGSDILFFWVARMVMLSYVLTGTKPFEKVSFHSFYFWFACFPLVFYLSSPFKFALSRIFNKCRSFFILWFGTRKERR